MPTANETAATLGDSLGIASSAMTVEALPRAEGKGAIIQANNRIFDVEMVGAGDVLHVAAGLERLRLRARSTAESIPLLVVPFMGSVGKELCDRNKVGWLDLCGNVIITFPGLRIQVEGKPDRFRRPGRPASLFAPVAARISRVLITRRTTFFPQRTLALAAFVDESYTGRIVTRLEKAGLVERNARGEVRAANPEVLLEALRETYRYRWTEIIHGRLEAPSPIAALQDLANGLANHMVHYATTGRAGAWLRMGAPDLQTVSLIIRPLGPVSTILKEIGVQISHPRPNVTLLVTKMGDVFTGMDTDGEICTAHPLQIYLDLLAQPEPDPEAAGMIRRRFFTRGVAEVRRPPLCQSR